MVLALLFSCFLALLATATFKKRQINFSTAHLSESSFIAHPVTFHIVDMLFVTYVPSPSNLYSRLSLKFSQSEGRITFCWAVFPRSQTSTSSKRSYGLKKA